MLAFANALGAALPRRLRPVWNHRGGSIRACSRSGPSIECNGSAEDGARSKKGFDIVSEERIFSRYLTVFQRDVRYPDGRIVSFDVIGNERSDFKSVFVFPFNTRSKTVTLIREYAPGPHMESLGFVAGMFERTKHTSLEQAARAELSEEARLKDGQLVALTGGMAADKYSRNEFFYFLALDCEHDERPGVRDEEEWISVVRDVGLDEVGRLVRDGRLNAPNAVCGLLGLDKLREMGYGI